jgi:hypothetical protein
MKSQVKALLLLSLACLALSGCVPTYSLVRADKPVPVASGTMKVKPAIDWNKAPPGASSMLKAEVWTQNGPVLDAIVFLGGVKDGAAIVQQQKKEDRKVPVFQAGMTPQDLVAMVESYYRIRAGATIFETENLKPTTFLNNKALDFTYRYVGSDNVKRRGRTVLTVVDQQLYLMTLDGADYYFAAAQPQFEALLTSATL